MKGVLKVIVLILTFQSCAQKKSSENAIISQESEFISFNMYSNDSIRDEIFEIAYQNTSTAPSYIVFRAKNKNSEEIKEICCEAPFLSGAIHRELGIGYDKDGIEYVDGIILSNKQKFFEFKSVEALGNISFFKYPNSTIVEQRAKKIDLDYYSETYGSNDSIKCIHFKNDTIFEQLTFAHIMFKCGILTSRDCFAGNNLWFGNPNKPK